MRLNRNAVATLVAAAFVFSGCRKPKDSGPSGDEVVLQIGQTVVTLRDFAEDFERAKLERGIAGDTTAASALKETLIAEAIKRELILRHAREIGMSVSAEEVAAEINRIRSHYPGESFREMLAEQYVAYDVWIERQKTRMLVEKVIAEEVENKITTTEPEVKAWFDAHPEISQEPERVKVRQILVTTEAEAKLLESRLKRGEDFASLAREKSISPEGREGGVMGVFAPGQVPTVMEVVFKLEPSKPSAVVQSEYGFHIFMVTERTPARAVTYEEVKPKVIEHVRAEKVEKVFPVWLQGLATDVKVIRNDAILAAIE